MTDEQRVRSALDYDIEPWQPDAGELMRRGRRLAWVRRGLGVAGVTALAGTVASVSMAVGGPAAVGNLLAGKGDSKPHALPSLPPANPTGLPTDLPSCLPSVPTGKPSLPTVP